MRTARIKLIGVEKMEAEMTLRMTVAEWQELAGQLSDRYPAWQLGSHIAALIRHAQASHTQELEHEA